MAENVTITGISRQAAMDIANEIARASGSTARGTAGAAGTSGVRDDDTRTKKKQREETEKYTRAVKTGSGSLKEFTEAAKKSKSAFLSAASSFKNLIGGTLMKGVLDEFRSSVSSGAEAFDGVTGYLQRMEVAYKGLGVTIQQLDEFNKTARAASINLGGYNEFAEQLTVRQRHYYQRLGDNAAAARHAAEMMNQLQHAGAAAVDLYGAFGKALDKTNDDLLKLGVSYEESRAIFKEMTEDEMVRHRLRGQASAEERKRVLLEIQERIKHFKMLGMTTEQAKAAAKALEQLGGKKPLDRYKQAAKAQAALTAMGVEGASEIGDIIRKGNRATEQERRRVQEVFGQAQDVAAEAAMGSMAQEFFVSTLVEKTGLQEMMGPGGVFSTKLDEDAKVNQGQLDAMQIVGQNTQKISDIMMTVDKLDTFISNNPWFNGITDAFRDIVGILTGILSALGISKLASAFGRGFKNIFGKGGVPDNLMDKTKPKGGGGRGLLSKLGRLGGRLLGPIAAAGIAGVSKFMDVKDREDLTKAQKTAQVASTGGGAAAGAVAGAMTGATIGAIGGPIGIAVGGFLGGTIGAIGGSKLGEWIGEKASGLLEPKAKKAAEDALKKDPEGYTSIVGGLAGGVTNTMGDFFTKKGTDMVGEKVGEKIEPHAEKAANSAAEVNQMEKKAIEAQERRNKEREQREKQEYTQRQAQSAQTQEVLQQLTRSQESLAQSPARQEEANKLLSGIKEALMKQNKITEEGILPLLEGRSTLLTAGQPVAIVD